MSNINSDTGLTEKLRRDNVPDFTAPLSASFMGTPAVARGHPSFKREGRMSVPNQHLKDSRERVEALKAPSVTHIIQNPSNAELKDWHLNNLCVRSVLTWLERSTTFEIRHPSMDVISVHFI
jgi:hypothetical protein